MTSTNEESSALEETVSDAPAATDVQFLEDRIDEFNMSHTGIRDVRFLSIILRDRSNDIVAGLYGWTWGACCEIKTLWVDSRWRGQGLGTRLLTAAQAEARARGAGQLVLSTHSFQAPDFYRQFGFEVIGAVDDYPVGHQSIFMRKPLR